MSLPPPRVALWRRGTNCQSLNSRAVNTNKQVPVSTAAGGGIMTPVDRERAKMVERGYQAEKKAQPMCSLRYCPRIVGPRVTHCPACQTSASRFRSMTQAELKRQVLVALLKLERLKLAGAI